jgi:hypothetical protein
MGRAIEKLSTEQQELLDSGLRILAHMIATSHIRRISLKSTSKCELSVSQTALPLDCEIITNNIQPENQGE